MELSLMETMAEFAFRVQFEFSTQPMLDIQPGSHHDVVLTKADKKKLKNTLISQGDKQNLKQLRRFTEPVRFRIVVRRLNDQDTSLVFVPGTETKESQSIVYVSMSVCLQTMEVEYHGMVPSRILFQDKYVHKDPLSKVPFFCFPFEELKPIWL
jgi:hypothetical protein